LKIPRLRDFLFGIYPKLIGVLIVALEIGFGKMNLITLADNSNVKCKVVIAIRLVRECVGFGKTAGRQCGEGRLRSFSAKGLAYFA
jgi:hypothetical protein